MPGGKIVVINHRMHEDDLCGQLLAQQAAGGDRWEVVELPAILAIADRLDGKPAQDSTVTIEKRDATDWSLTELVSLFHERRAARARDITPGGSTTELN